MKKRNLFSILTLILSLMLAVTMAASCSSDTPSGPVDTGKDESKETEPIKLDPALLAAKLTGFKIVRPDVAGEATVDAAVKLRKALEHNGMAMELETDWVKRGTELPTDTAEILVGTTNRPETAAFTGDLRYDDFAVAKEGGRYVIVGGSDGATMAAMDWFIENALTFEGDTLYKDGDSYVYHKQYRLMDAAIGGTPIKDCKISYSSNIHNAEAKAAELRALILQETGYQLEIVTNSKFTKDGGKGILLVPPAKDGEANSYNVSLDGAALKVGAETRIAFNAAFRKLTNHIAATDSFKVDGSFKLAETLKHEKVAYYVDASAKGGDGSKAKPFGTIEEVMAAAAVRAQEGPCNFTINLKAGEYILSEPILLDAATYDTFGCTFDFICEDKEKAVLAAWIRIDGFDTTEKVNGVDAWVAKLPEVNGETLYPHQMFALDGTRLERPRWPEEDFLYALNGKGPEIDSLKDAAQRDRMDSLRFREGEIPEGLTRLSDIQMRMFHWWDDEKLTVKDIDYENRWINFTTASEFAFKENNGDGARYFLDNVFEALNDPGEVYADRESGKIYYIPRKGEKQDGFALYASNLEHMLTIDGVHNISFENIAFSGSDWKTVERYTGQAARDIETAAVSLNNTSHVTFENCDFTHIGTKAIRIIQAVNNVTISHCVMDDLGAGAIEIVGVNMEEPDETVVHNIHITDCQISRFGRVFANGVGVLLRNAHDCTIAHNDIYDGYYTGISIGWRWGYDYSVTNNLLVEKNHIYDIGQRLLSDMGGIYSLGPQPGTVLRGNLIHDIAMYSYGGWAIYPDEGSSEILIENNVCYNTTATVFHQHYGKDNIVRNNIFAFGDGGAFIITRKEEHNSLTLERNILLTKGTPIYAKAADQMNMKDNSNLIWDMTTPDPISGAMNFDPKTITYTFPDSNKRTVDQMKAAGLFNNVLIADPLFKDAENYDFTLSENSPAFDIGFVPIDISDVGPRK